MNEILQKIEKVKLVPVVKIDNPRDAVSLGRVLVDGGLPVADLQNRSRGGIHHPIEKRAAGSVRRSRNGAYS